jgi:RNA polymerase-binding protein DksA
MALTPAEIDFFRRRLQSRRDELLAALRAGTENSADKNLTEQSAPVRDPGDESVALTTADANMGELQSDTEEIRAIDAALARIDQGVYGKCLDCGEVIPLARLDAYPTAERCTECQARRENFRGGVDRTPTL